MSVMSGSTPREASTQTRQCATFEDFFVGGDVGIRAKIIFGSSWKEGDTEPGSDETILINADKNTIDRAAAEKIWRAQPTPLREDEVRAYQTTVTMREDGFFATFLYEPKVADITDHRGEPVQACVEIGVEEPQVIGGSATIYARSKGGGKGKTPQEWMTTPEAERATRFLEANSENNGTNSLQNTNPSQTQRTTEPFTGRSQQLTTIDSADQTYIEDWTRGGLLGDTHILQTDTRKIEAEEKMDTTLEARRAANAAMQEAYEVAELQANNFLKSTTTSYKGDTEKDAADVTASQKTRLDQNPALSKAIENSLKVTKDCTSSRERLPSARGSTCFLMDELNQLDMQRNSSHSEISSMGAKHESDNESL